MSLLLDALRQVDQIKHGISEPDEERDDYTQNLQHLSEEIEQLAQHVSHTAQTLLDDQPLLSTVAQQSIDDAYTQIKENNIPVLTPLQLAEDETIEVETVIPPHSPTIEVWPDFVLEPVTPPPFETLLTQIPHAEPLELAREEVAEPEAMDSPSLSSEPIIAEVNLQQKKIVDHLMRQHHRKKNWQHVFELCFMLGLGIVFIVIWKMTDSAAPIPALDIAQATSAPLIVEPVVEPIMDPEPIVQTVQPTFVPSTSVTPSAAPSAASPVIAQPKVANKKRPVDNTPDVLTVSLQQAYQAFQNNDLQKAQQRYQQIIDNAPYNRDALLGLAAVAIAQKKNSQAMRYYLQLLQLDPQDDVAHSGVLSLSDMGQGPEVETQLTQFAERYPASAAINFFLGTFYAKHQQWPVAQRYFFKAYSLDNRNAHYAYNLAVSLDQLKQLPGALQYYDLALKLSENQPLQFSAPQVRKRRDQLHVYLERS